MVAFDGMPAPGLPAGTVLRLPLTSGGFEIHPSINNRGEVAFPAWLESPDPDLDFRWSIWTEDGGTLRAIAIAIAIEGQVPAGVDDPGAELARLGRRVLIDETGHTAFTARVSGEPGDADTGLFAQILADPSVVRFEGTVADGVPDLSGDGVPDFLFTDFLGVEPLMNARGVVAFKNRAATPDNSLTDDGIWIEDRPVAGRCRPAGNHRGRIPPLQ